MGALYSALFPKPPPPPEAPIGLGERISNTLKCHYKGWGGILLPVILFPTMFKMHEHDKTVHIMWWTLLWFMLLKPVALPVVAMIPIFLMPVLGVMPTGDICKCYMNENIHLHILTSALILLMNNSGVDRRIALWFICSGDDCQFSGPRLVFKYSSAGFFLSMVSSRTIASSTLIEYAYPSLMVLKGIPSKQKEIETNYNTLRNVVVSSIHTSCSIGSLVIFHASPTIICMKAIFTEYPGKKKMFPDIFNYLQFSVYSVPVAIVIFALNLIYHLIIVKIAVRPMNLSAESTLRKEILKFKSKIPKEITLHEKYSLVFVVIYLLAFFLRWSRFFNMGWADFSRKTAGGSDDIPACKDATVAAVFLAILHIMPKSFNFLKVLTASKRSELPPLKVESAILFWRFVDKKINYSYMFVFGCGISLLMCARDTGLALTIRDNLGKQITKHSLIPGLLLICVLSTIFSNVITGIGGLIVFLPYLMCSTGNEGPLPSKTENVSNVWLDNQYLCALAIGMISSMSFMWPFIETPSYFARTEGKMKNMTVCKYGFGSAVIGMLVVWLSLIAWAPFVWDPEGKGIHMVPEAVG